MKKYTPLITSMLITACTTITATPKEQQDALSAHNQLRALHHAPALTWNTQLATYAARYASHCEFEHSHGPYGENLAAGYPSIKASIAPWYAEYKYYDYKKPEFSYQTGHFTQLVWKSSTQLGCAFATCNGKHGTPGKFLVCEYNPPGNVTNANYFRKNVLP